MYVQTSFNAVVPMPGVWTNNHIIIITRSKGHTLLLTFTYLHTVSPLKEQTDRQTTGNLELSIQQ